jgi:hypothetical protein
LKLLLAWGIEIAQAVFRENPDFESIRDAASLVMPIEAARNSINDSIEPSQIDFKYRSATKIETCWSSNSDLPNSPNNAPREADFLRPLKSSKHRRTNASRFRMTACLILEYHHRFEVLVITRSATIAALAARNFDQVRWPRLLEKTSWWDVVSCEPAHYSTTDAFSESLFHHLASPKEIRISAPMPISARSVRRGFRRR